MIDMFCAGSDDPCLETELSEDGASPKFLAFFIGITLWWTNIAMEHGPVEIVDLPMKNGDCSVRDVSFSFIGITVINQLSWGSQK